MAMIWQVALSNAVLVAAGMPIVWLVGRYARRPALTHGLAVILLLKLITPPLWRVPVSWPEEAPATATAIEKQIAAIETQQAPDATTPPVAGSTGVLGVHDGQYRVIITDPDTGRIREIQTHILPPSAVAPSQSESERLDRIEGQLRMLMDEMAKMRETTPARGGLPPAGPLPQ